MKEVMAIIRFNKINITKRALVDAGFASITMLKTMGRGKGNVDYLLLAGAEGGHEEAISQLGPSLKLVPKRLITLVVPDDQVKTVVNTVIEVNRTENHGDGKIFVMPVLEAVRLRTGERGEDAIDSVVNVL
ncbi:MAG: P-II family nitrogen regulator [Dehalococcoides mccartyi]|jgi:Nitrogen regulatory protein PII|uniref:Nitrogen fixation protein n=3 Tax=root TaxID=1 RepID=A0A0V8M060_9CHLR|nr:MULTISPECIES: P-II family nitrogen regulator [Dehalococcoides]AAW39627.1 nitrogen regulatory protein P-II [Dehalococcoides mccartyi 195]AII59716.1 nitrogen fixation regulatory protein II [Dehalococcoides mccartyi CG4]AQU03417.1 P-II family nitrogen regulator [Dehalococcoides mccartyi]AQU04715.1 P-II family nitrogen regulator [Dehalococcoides mccartyi]KSV17158.1 nitrogen fixation protein [Dehalococcoides mccartyi]